MWHLLAWRLSPRRVQIDADVSRWREILVPAGHPISHSSLLALLLWRHPEFRGLFYHRLGKLALPLRPMLPAESTLHFACTSLGTGLFIQHGFATIITAESIGQDCWINQQVTIGFAGGPGCPILGDRVTVGAGAKVLGPVTVGDDAIIGANAVVTKDVPAGATVVGIPARVIKLHGQRVSTREPSPPPPGAR
jgi:serine O-acetyltransferase